MQSFLFRLLTKLVLTIGFITIFHGVSVSQLMEIDKLKRQLEKENSEIETARVYTRLGMLYTNRSLDSTYYYAARALDIAQNHQNKEIEAHALNVLAFYYMERGNSYLGYKFVHDALELFEHQNDAEGIVMLNMNLGVFLMREGKMDQALEQFELADQKSLSLEKDSIRSLILMNMTFPKARFLSAAEMESIYEEAFEIANRYQDERMLFAIRQAKIKSIVPTPFNQKDIRLKIQNLISESQIKGFDVLRAGFYADLGTVFLQSDRDSAVYYFEKGIDLAEQRGYKVLMYGLMVHAYEVFSRDLGSSEIAAQYSSRLLNLGEQIRKEDPHGGINYLELVLRESEMEVQQTKHEMRRLWMLGAILTGAIAVLITLLMLRQYLVKKRLASRLQEMNQRLTQQNVQLEQNDEFQKKLLSILSHDLRQPFSSIIMMSKDMWRNLDTTDRKVVLDDLYQSASVSLQTIDGLLYWMKLQTLGLAYTPNKLVLRESIEQAIEFNRHLIVKNGLHVQVEVDETVEVDAQREMLLFVNRNIIHNAIKYSPSGGIITVSTTVEKDYIIVRISDHGPGIPQDILPGLFSKDKQKFDNNTSHAGTGIAMLICDEMLQSMRGKIWATNNPTDDDGASFYYMLPYSFSPSEAITIHQSATIKKV